MSIKAYVGRMGSGKTYEVASVVIYKALASGRRVVSNIAGLDIDAYKALMIEQGIPEDRIGELVQINHEQVLDPYFWRSDEVVSVKKVEPKKAWRVGKWGQRIPVVMDEVLLPDEDATPKEFFIQPGDLLALDEIWRFWSGFNTKDGDGNKRPATVMNFFRMHRHFTHPVSGVSCDVALITQDVMDLSRSVRAVIEETYYMEKHTALGSTKRYRVDIFQGGTTNRKPIRQLQRIYEAKYFPLYSSHSQKKEGDADAVEQNIDQRGNLLKGALFKIVLPIGLIVMLIAVYTVISFFNPKPKDKPGAVPDAKGGTAQPATVSHAKPAVDVSDEWRAAGYYINRAGVSIYLVNDHRSRVVHNPPNYRLTGLEVETILPNGEAVAGWTGIKTGGLVPGAK